MGDFRPALRVLLDQDAAGLSAANITRLVGVWQAEYEAFSLEDFEGCEHPLGAPVDVGLRESVD